MCQCMIVDRCLILAASTVVKDSFLQIVFFCMDGAVDVQCMKCICTYVSQKGHVSACKIPKGR